MGPDNPLLNAIMSGLETAGYVLDTPGALLRGLLAGRAGERVGGRELLETWGVLGENQAGFDAGDVAGFGAEMLLDPLNLVGGGLVKRGLGLADDAADASRSVKASTTQRQLLPETVQKINKWATEGADPRFGGPKFQLNDADDFKDLYMRSQDWASFDEATGKRVKVPNALVVAKVEANKQGEGTYRALHDELMKYNRPIVVEAVGNQPFMDKLDHMGYQKIASDYESGFGHNYVYPPIDPPYQGRDWTNPLLAAIAANAGIQTAGGY